MTLREMGTPEARAEWEAWREAEPNRGPTGRCGADRLPRPSRRRWC